MTSGDTGHRLIEDWLPINEISVEAVREGGALAGHPPVNQLHVWWARRPLIVSRATVAASILPEDANRAEFISNIGTSPDVVTARRQMDETKATGQWSNISFPNRRSFLHNPKFLSEDSGTAPMVLDITAGGGSIPFEAGRLGFRTIANELNPVAGLILRATCEWPQKYGGELQEHFQEVRGRFLDRVRELTGHLYPEEPQPEVEHGNRKDETVRAKRYAQTYLFARTVTCPSCEGTIPLSPNWRSGFQGNRHQGGAGCGVRHLLIRDSHEGIRPDPRNRFTGQGYMPLPQLRGDNPGRIHLPGGPRWETGTPALLHHLPRHLANKNQIREALQAPQDLQGIPGTKTRAMTIRKRLIPDWPELAESWGTRRTFMPTEEVPHGDKIYVTFTTMECPDGATCSVRASFWLTASAYRHSMRWLTRIGMPASSTRTAKPPGATLPWRWTS